MTKFSFRSRLIIIIFTTLTLSFSLVAGWIYYRIKQQLISDNVDVLKVAIELTHPIIKKYQKLEEDKNISQIEAQRLAMSEIRNLRFGNNDYLWINDMTPKMVMHPIQTQLDGQDLSEIKDPNGKAIFKEFIEIVKSNGAGVLMYEWPKPGSQKPVPKVSYVFGIPKWNWILGTGVYIEDVDDVLNSVMVSIVGVLLVILLISFFVTTWVAQRLLKPVQMVAQVLDEGSELIRRASEDLTSTSVELSMSTNQQSSAIQETSASMEEISGMVENNMHVSESSALNIEQVKNNMNLLQGAMGEILKSNEQLDNLGKIIESIGSKTKIIDEIVFQTKLLSFNASVEAERAGDHGRGFAVVAQEVGNLARMSGQSAIEISLIIRESLNQVELMVEDNRRKVKGGIELLSEVRTKVDEVAKASKAVVKASKDQTGGLLQVNEAVSQISQAIQENAESSSKTAIAGSDLLTQAEELRGAIVELNQFIKGKAS